MAPPLNKWTGDLFDLAGMAKPFDRSKSNQWFEDAIKDAQNPGTTGDLAVTTTQIDLLATAERAFRARHSMRRSRAIFHAMGRKTGHGNDGGPLVQGMLEHVRAMVKQSKGKG